jgi:hypothetical protein
MPVSTIDPAIIEILSISSIDSPVFADIERVISEEARHERAAP